MLVLPFFRSLCDHSNERLQAVLFVVLFIMLYKVVLTFESVDEILKCNDSNESYQAVLSCGAVYHVLQCSSAPTFSIESERNP